MTQLYSSITTEDAYNAAAVNYNELPPHEQAYRNSLQPPQVNNSGRPSMTVNQRSASCDESVTVHDLRKQSVNLLRYECTVSNCKRLLQKTNFSLSPMKQLRPTSANPTVTPTSSNRGSSINIIPIENPEKRLSIRPLMTTAPPLPSCPEISGSDSSSEGPLSKIRTWDRMGNSILKPIHILFKKS